MQQLALALGVLTRGVRYWLAPGQDLGFDLSRMPTHPRSGVVIHHVQLLDTLEAPLARPPSPGAPVRRRPSAGTDESNGRRASLPR